MKSSHVVIAEHEPESVKIMRKTDSDRRRRKRKGKELVDS